MKIFILIIFFLHGFIHILGFVKAFKLAKVDQLTSHISKSFGIIWLLTALFFISSGVLFYFENYLWIITTSMGIIISQTLIIFSWKEAKFGTIANIILIAAIVITLM